MGVLSQPAIEYTRTVDTKQYTVGRFVGAVVHMHKSVHARPGIERVLVGDALDHSGGSRRRCGFSGLENVQGKGIVWLITRAIRYLCSRI